MSFFLDTLIDGRYHDAAVYSDAETAKLAARRMSQIDGWRVYSADRKTFNPVKPTRQPRVNSEAAFDAQVEFTVRHAKSRKTADQVRPVPIHVYPAPANHGYSHDFRLAVARGLLAGELRRTAKHMPRDLVEALAQDFGYEFIEVDPGDWDPKVSSVSFDCLGCGRDEDACSADPCNAVLMDREAVLVECPACGALFVDDEQVRCPSCAEARS